MLDAHAGFLRINIQSASKEPIEVISYPPTDDATLQSRRRPKELASCWFSTDLPYQRVFSLLTDSKGMSSSLIINDEL